MAKALYNEPYILVKFRVFKTTLHEVYLVYRAQTSEKVNSAMPFQYSELIFSVARLENEAHMLMKQ